MRSPRVPFLAPPPPHNHILPEIICVFYHLKELKLLHKLVTSNSPSSCCRSADQVRVSSVARRSELVRKVRPTRDTPPPLSLPLYQSVRLSEFCAVRKVNLPPPEVPARIHRDLKSSWNTNVHVFVWNRHRRDWCWTGSCRPGSGGQTGHLTSRACHATAACVRACVRARCSVTWRQKEPSQAFQWAHLPLLYDSLII